MEDNTSKVYVEPGGPQPPIVSQGSGSGTQLYVINLCASIAPVSTTGRNIPGLDNYRLYQVARVEDGRTRHRLRLGFFTNEAHAERVLTVVRQQYPTAFTTSLGDEDRRFTRGYLPESPPAAAPAAPAQKRPAVAVVNTAPAPQAVAKPVLAPVQAPTKVAVPAAAPAAAKAAVAKPAAPKAPPKPAAKKAESEVVEMTWEPDEETKAAATSASLPRIKALTEAAGLAEMSWDEVPPTPAPVSTSTTQSIKGPLGAGLLSGKFAALDTTRLKAASASKPAVTPPAAARPVTPPAPVNVPPKLDTSASVRVPALTFSDPVPTAATAPKSNGPAEPYHVGKGLKIEEVDDFELDLYEEPAAKAPAPAAMNGKAPAQAAAKPAANNKLGAAKPAAAPMPPVAKKIEAPAKPAAPVAARPGAPIAKPAASLLVRDSSSAHPNLDSTQTIRALTTEEMNDGAQEKWFAIQLAASEQPVNLDTMPHLDIFEAYSLYSVATAGSGKIVHSLRLGFFKEAVSAEAVTGYLKTFFASPTVLRISVAEQARFKDAPQPRRSEPEEPKSNVVDLNNARGRAPVVPTVTMEVAPTSRIDPMATGSFRPNATGAFKPGATGAFKPGATGTFKPSATGAFKLNSTGMHNALGSDGKIAAKSAGPATKRSEPTRASMTGKNKALKKSLAEELMEEAREVELSESGIRKLPQNNSLLSRLLGKKK